MKAEFNVTNRVCVALAFSIGCMEIQLDALRGHKHANVSAMMLCKEALLVQTTILASALLAFDCSKEASS